jgi:cyanophycinase
MNCGELLIIGGAEDKCLEGEVLNKFVQLAIRSDGGIGILPTASEIPEEVSTEYIKIFRDLGVDRVEVIKLDSRQDADEPATTIT